MIKHLLKTIALYTLVFTAVNSVIAGELDAEPTPIFGAWHFSGYVGNTAINKQVAKTEKVGESALTFGFTADYEKGPLLSSIGMSFLTFEDKAGFSQDTTGGEKDSSASGMQLTAATGGLWRLGSDKSIVLSAQAGLGLMVESSRSISYCSDCSEEKIDISSGVFGKVSALKNINQSFAMGLSYTRYFGTDDLDSEVALVFSSAY